METPQNILRHLRCWAPRSSLLLSSPFTDALLIGCAHSLKGKRTEWVGAQRLDNLAQGEGTPTVANKSGHVVQLQQPEVIIAAIRQIVESIRTEQAAGSSRVPVLSE